MQVPKRKPGKYAQTPDDYHLTHAAIKALRDEMDRLEKIVRPRAVEELRRTREMGDLSENFAYSQAKGRLMGLDHRLLEIKDRLKNAIPIAHGPTADGRARIGATVDVEVNGKTKTYDITGSQETDPTKGQISHLSPLGAALIGKKAGETIVIAAGGKDVTYRILEVR